MTARARSGPPIARRNRRAIASVLLALALAAPGAHAAAADGTPRAHAATWISLGVLSGSTRIDPRLSDYSWDTRPRAAWGALATAGRGPLELGARAWRSSTRQAMALPGLPASPTVRSTTLELLARARVATLLGTRVSVDASVGTLRIDYRPGHLSVPQGAGAPLEVDLAPIGTTVAGGGLSLRRVLPGSWALGLAMDRRYFGLDTAHRRGAEIVYGRETFGDWSARLEFARLFTLGAKGAWR
jgi:hypothetical protein